jgi:hypothetical protein
MLDEKMNPLFFFIQHRASSIQHRFAFPARSRPGTGKQCDIYSTNPSV